MEMDIVDGMNIIAKAVEKRDDDRTWQIWANLYPNFTQENYISYKDFKDKAIQKPKPKVKSNAPKRSDDELINDATNILKMMK